MAAGERSDAVRTWLYGVAALVVAMVAVGGATRLTGSGLSITEWRPVTGILPPLTQADWAAEFAKYRDTPQYAILNRGIGLPAFQVLYAWEWGHRLLGRALGLAFFLPLIVFWWRGRISRRLGAGLLGLGVLGALQGAIGWIMVASGLQPGMTAVAPLKLALHLSAASLILAGLVWLAAGEGRILPHPASGRLRACAGLLPLLLLTQIFLGGLVAGSHAGLVYNTWPGMDGALLPPLRDLFPLTPWIENVVDTHALVQLDHRLMAYLVLLACAAHALDAWVSGSPRAARRAIGVLVLALSQAALGIATLLLAVPLWAALAHQVLAMAVLAAATAHARLSRGIGSPGRVGAASLGAEPAARFEGLADRGV